MLVDACLFDGEFDMLEFRFRLLHEYVDRFVVVEADKTYSGEPRPFVLTEDGEWNKRFAWIRDKVQVHQVALKDDQFTTTAISPKADFRYEFQHRNGIAAACATLAGDDLIIISDVDEIPNRDIFSFISQQPGLLPNVCEQQVFFYNLRFLHKIAETDGIWRGSVIATARQMRQYSPQGLRDGRGAWPSIANAGWHFSNFGGVERLQHKLKSFAHYVICDKPEFTNTAHLEACLKTGEDPCGRKDIVQEVGPDFFPDYVIEAAQKYGWAPSVASPARPLISVLHPTARPRNWEAAYQTWAKNCDDPSRVEYVLVPEWNLDLSQHQTLFENTVVEQNHGRPSLVDGFNQAAQLSHGAILVVGADDVFAAPHWDTEILKVLGDKLDQEVVLHIDNPGVMTQPILTRPYYERYGYLYWHEYFGWYADEEFTDVARQDGVVITDFKNRSIFHHDHQVLDPRGTIAAPVEDVYKRIVIEGRRTGEQTFKRRKEAGFPRESYLPLAPQPLISLLHTTCRQGKWEEACRAWYETADDASRVEYVLVPERGRFDTPTNLEIPFDRQVIEFSKGRPCPVDGWNQAAQISHGKVLMLVADDLFATPHWDTKLLDALGSKIDQEAVVWVHADPNDVRPNAIMTHPIMTRAYHDRYGFLLWPEYENWCVEVELTEVAQRDGVIIDARKEIQFEHRAPGLTGSPKDADNLKIEKWYPQAQKLLDARRALGFPRLRLGGSLAQVQRVGEAGAAPPKLSILICSLPQRSAMLHRLLDSLRGQAWVLPNPGDVEVLYLVDNQKMSIGTKRNKLIEAARGQYTCFVDDDDRVWADYIVQIFDAMKGEPDCIGMSGISTANGLYPKISYFSDAAKVLQGLPLRSLKQGASNDSVPIAHVCHLSPIKRSITSRVKFQNISWSEDRFWTQAITPLIKTVTVLEKPIYHYDYRSNITAAPNPDIHKPVPVRAQIVRQVPDKLVRSLSELPDWVLVNLIKNVSAPLASKKLCLKLLQDRTSPLAENAQVLEGMRKCQN